MIGNYRDIRKVTNITKGRYTWKKKQSTTMLYIYERNIFFKKVYHLLLLRATISVTVDLFCFYFNLANGSKVAEN